jgi:hypothetical protein
MNNYSKRNSVNSRRSFIVGFGGVLEAAAALVYVCQIPAAVEQQPMLHIAGT